jgi:hypothetical protein
MGGNRRNKGIDLFGFEAAPAFAVGILADTRAASEQEVERLLVTA